MKKLSIIFLLGLIAILFACTSNQEVVQESPGQIMTVNGPISPDSLGLTLIHEHVFLDWTGADSIQPQNWDTEAAFDTILPYLLGMSANGVKSFLECTPNYLGRNPKLLQRLAAATGLQILTNTGYYGARQNQYLPEHAFQQDAAALADIWTQEWEEGIDGTEVRPGFIKIGVDGDSVLSDIHAKLVRAAAITHLNTGLTIVAHTGPDAPAFQEVEILAEEGVAPDALVWTHAQNGTQAGHVALAQKGVWVSLDGLGWVAPVNGDSTALYKYVDAIVNLKKNNLLHRTLISHDAGWYTHGANEQNYQSYTNIFEYLMPILKEKGFTDEDFNQLMVENPKVAYSIEVRELL